VSETSAPFWDAVAEDRFVLQWSTVADRPVHYPRHRSPLATDDDLTWRDVDPVATVIATTVVHRHSHAEFADQVPFGLALVEVAGAARLLVRFDPDSAPEVGGQVRIGRFPAASRDDMHEGK
jgi:uncharacterized protein